MASAFSRIVIVIVLLLVGSSFVTEINVGKDYDKYVGAFNQAVGSVAKQYLSEEVDRIETGSNNREKNLRKNATSSVTSAPVKDKNSTISPKLTGSAATMSRTNTTKTTNSSFISNHTRTNETNFSSIPPPPLNHAFAGARYPNGSWGYIADVTTVRKRVARAMTGGINPAFYNMSMDERDRICGEPGSGFEKDAGYKLLTNKVVVNGPTPMPPNQTGAILNDNKKPPPRILCLIYTHEGRHEAIKLLGELWGHKCDGFLAASTKTVPEIGAVDLAHEGPEEYGNMWQKTRSIFAYAHQHYLNDYDFFHLGGDDLYLIVENLRNYLATLDNENGTKLLYLGHQIPVQKGIMCGGGPGYTLNRASLAGFMTIIDRCAAGVKQSFEDRLMSNCMRDLGVKCHDTADALGEQRYCGFDPNFAATHKGNKGYFKGVYENWAKTHGFRWGENLTSSQTVSFHLLKWPDHIKRIHAILYHTCPNGTKLFNSLNAS